MFPFGSYVQGTLRNDPTNTNAPRTVDAIYLRSMPNDQGGHEAMSLSTGKKITPNRVFEIPVTDTVIKHVEAMANAQGIKSLKLTNRLKTRFYPADWIAGVDYNPENPETYEDEEDEDYKHEDSDEDSWVNPDEDRMSPEREE